MKAMHAPMISEIINRLKLTELLDYCCGRDSLMDQLRVIHKMTVQLYDPAIPELAGEAIPMQMVVCIDVLQDVEPERIDAVLDDLKRVTGTVGYISILQTEERTLIEQDKAWWLDKIMTRWDLHCLQTTPTGYFMVVYPLPQPLVEPIERIERVDLNV